MFVLVLGLCFKKRNFASIFLFFGQKSVSILSQITWPLVLKIKAYFAYLAMIRPIFPIFFTESMVEQTEFAWQESSSIVSYCTMP